MKNNTFEGQFNIRSPSLGLYTNTAMATSQKVP